MDFNEYKIYREKKILENNDLIDLGNNNLYEFFSKIKQDLEKSPEYCSFNSMNVKYYRCHTVEAYLKKLGLPDELKKITGASLGIRQSLVEVLFKQYQQLIIPKDVYPFYSDNSNSIYQYQTYGNFELFSNIPDGELLICYPMKPNNRNFSPKEWVNLQSFLKHKTSNRIIFDMVYLTDWKIPQEILELYNTNQVIMLHSLSKTYLIPNCFGIAILPNNDDGLFLYNQFRLINKNEHKLKIANFYLQNSELIHQYNKNIKNQLFISNSILQRKYGYDFGSGYLLVVNETYISLLAKNILAIPGSVFGGTDDYSIVSSLINAKNLLQLLII